MAATEEREMMQTAVQEAPQDAVQIDVDVDGNTMEWEVETEPAPDTGYTETYREEVYEEPYQDAYEDPYAAGTPVAKRINKHLFTWLLSFYLGIFGADRFYRGQWVLGLAKLMTFGGFGFWYLADLIIAVIKSYGEGYRDMDDLMFDIYGRYIY